MEYKLTKYEREMVLDGLPSPGAEDGLAKVLHDLAFDKRYSSNIMKEEYFAHTASTVIRQAFPHTWDIRDVYQGYFDYYNTFYNE